MLVTILGSPCSGKTTAAALAFHILKTQGAVAEFITEQARWYIAQKRVKDKIQHFETMTLSDEDQLSIMEQQLEHELTMKLACDPETIVLSDSSALNSLLYMSSEFKNSESVKRLTDKAIQNYDSIYYAKPLQHFPYGDSNRVHDKDFALSFDQRLPQLIEELNIKVSGFLETPADRESLAFHILRDKYSL